MADEERRHFWVTDSTGLPRGFHWECGTWLGLQPEITDREPYHTEICRGCGRFMDAQPPDKGNTAPMDGKLVL